VQQLLDRLDATLRRFATQSDDFALVVQCADGEAALVSKSLDGVADSLDTAMVWAVVDEFADAASYASAAVNAFYAQHAAVRLAMLREGDPEPWPEFPPALLDAARPPVERLRGLMTFSRALLARPDEMTAVWALFPLAVHDAAGWAGLLGELLPHQFPAPWCHHLRVVARGVTGDALLPSALGALPRLKWYAPELHADAIAAALDEDAANPALPLPQRLQGLLLSAGMDFSHRRYDQALAKYQVLLKYYAGIRDGAMAALVCNGIGEVHARLGNRDVAGLWFGRAIEPAAAAPTAAVPVLLVAALNLGNLRMEQERWGEAEACFDGAQKLATLQRDPQTKLRTIDSLGVCQYMQGKFDAATATWTAGAHVATELQVADLRQTMLYRLHHLYGYLNDGARQAQIAHLLASPMPAPSDASDASVAAPVTAPADAYAPAALPVG
jgi:tetratricopeptide (TPR) repeat protein